MLHSSASVDVCFPRCYYLIVMYKKSALALAPVTPTRIPSDQHRQVQPSQLVYYLSAIYSRLVRLKRLPEKVML